MTVLALAAENRDLLAQYACSNVLAAFDYDGTLAPIVECPDDATMRPRTRELLAELCRCYPAIVISGRSQADVLARLEGVEVFAAIGNHGSEPWRCTAEDRERVLSWKAKLQPHLTTLEGVWIEDKGYSLSVHYRQAPDVAGAEAEIRCAVSGLSGARVIGGKRVYNVLPQAAPGKGDALEMARQWLGCDTVLYAGDDETDEDVFRLEAPGRLLTVRVGWTPASKARLFLRDQADIDELLEMLVALRRGRSPRAARDSTNARREGDG